MITAPGALSPSALAGDFRCRVPQTCTFRLLSLGAHSVLLPFKAFVFDLQGHYNIGIRICQGFSFNKMHPSAFRSGKQIPRQGHCPAGGWKSGRSFIRDVHADVASCLRVYIRNVALGVGRHVPRDISAAVKEFFRQHEHSRRHHAVACAGILLVFRGEYLKTVLPAAVAEEESSRGDICGAVFDFSAYVLSVR